MGMETVATLHDAVERKIEELRGELKRKWQDEFNHMCANNQLCWWRLDQGDPGRGGAGPHRARGRPRLSGSVPSRVPSRVAASAVCTVVLHSCPPWCDVLIRSLHVLLLLGGPDAAADGEGVLCQQGQKGDGYGEPHDGQQRARGLAQHGAEVLRLHQEDHHQRPHQKYAHLQCNPALLSSLAPPPVVHQW
eukprot:1113399-Pyramimonas_sp.AAC.1